MATFLAGSYVDPEVQAKAAGFHEIEQLLTLPADRAAEVINKVLKGSETK